MSDTISNSNHKKEQSSQYRSFTTAELLQYVKQCSEAHDKGERDNAIVEAMIINGQIRVTHFLEWWNGRLHDEGCDGHRIRTSLKEFTNRYPRTIFYLDEFQ